MIKIDKKQIIEYNKRKNEAEWWCNEALLDSALSSYHYYETELEQICSVFRGLAKNHAFSNANKRTALGMLVIFLYQNGYVADKKGLIELTEDVTNGQYEVQEIVERLKQIINPI